MDWIDQGWILDGIVVCVLVGIFVVVVLLCDGIIVIMI